ncbi:molybdopterin molybdotransferase MoeA [Altererythrobacter sp. MF3-039]|uniref:molybdopterin molybdotransferase MoeA n=1 Tax=Altererythrobacter sp. MF3-039 TaxID=3252901 RepID=UPI00390C5BFA
MSLPPKPIPLEEAWERLLSDVAPLGFVTVAVRDAPGSYLAEDLKARRTQPVTDLSAMDGYVVRSDDCVGPWQVIGESAAGHPFGGTLSAGEAIRISTGAHMPTGEVAVLLQENAEREGERLSINGKGEPTERHIRRAGYDFSDGQALLGKGTRIGAAQLALAISSGHGELAVHRLPSLGVIDSGDELSASLDNCGPNQIPASNGAMLAAMAAPYTSEVRALGPVEDRMESILDAFDAAASCDVIVTTGGASVGDHDLIRPALEQWGAKIDFWRVAIKPGKPLMVGRKGSQIILGLPGNPGSAYVTAFLFLLPLLRRLAGSLSPNPSTIALPTAVDIGHGHKRREFLRAVYREGMVEPLGSQDSGGMHALAISNALIDRPSLGDEVKAGTSVPVYLLENG